MDQTWSFALTLSTFFSIIIFILLRVLTQSNPKIRKARPPGPPSLPIIGHLHKLKQPLHRTLQKFSSQYGPVYSLKFGDRPVVVISSPAAVEECFTKHDVVLANRPRMLVGKHLNYDWTTIGAASYGPLWRNLRRVTTLEFFSTTKLSLLTSMREEEVRALVKGLFGTGETEFVSVEMRSKFTELTFNIIMRMVTGKRYFGEETEGFELEEAIAFRGIARDVFQLSGATSMVDWLPFLRWVDFQNLEGRMLSVRKNMDGFLDVLIEECRTKRDCRVDEGKRMPLIYTLLNLQESEPENYSDQIIKGIIMNMVTAGIDTSTVTMEWALSLLLNHPDVLENARQEIHQHVGEARLVEESDLPKLTWIQNIINETLRLFPSVPLLAPHEPSEDCTIAGYHVQRGTMVLINAWAIHRDPNLWEDHSSFRPERFKGVKGEAYRLKLMPFGLGRRACPGAPLAYRVVGLVLATLVQCLDWKKVSEESVDLAEGFGLSMPKATPLEAMFKARQSMINVLEGI